MYFGYDILKSNRNHVVIIIEEIIMGGDHMPTGVEVAKAAIDDFNKIQRYMQLAKKENATETYAELKEEYLSLKAILEVCGVNLTNIDKIKE